MADLRAILPTVKNYDQLASFAGVEVEDTFYRRSAVVRPLMTVMLALLFSACATGPTQPVWTPAVDVSSSEDPGRFNTDLAECRESAVEASGWEPDAPFALGRSHAIGIGGAVQSALIVENHYREVYAKCLRERGYRVADYY